MTQTFKMTDALKQQVQDLGTLKYAWFTSFNLNVDFFERHVLSTLLEMEPPRSRIDFELMQQKLNGSVLDNRKAGPSIDVKVFADQRMYDANDVKRTAIEVYGVAPVSMTGVRKSRLDKSSLFHPKVIFLQDDQGKAILGVGSANLTQSGWSTNQEVFSFHQVECAHQAEAIRCFFKPLFKFNAIKHPFKFGKTLRKAPSPSDWYFVHTFLNAERGSEHTSLLGHLLNEPNTKELVVWSPYFPRDLAGFIDRLRGIHSSEELTVCLIPDLVENKQMRTEWSSSLNDQINDQQLRFYRNPVQPDERSELCHAKVWMTEHKLAIGSWNFTAPGSNIALEEGESGHVNVEAGVVFNHTQPLTDVLKESLTIGEGNFMESVELNAHALEVAELLPVNVRVSFDWETLTYNLAAEKVDKSQVLQSVEIRLPDIIGPISFVFETDGAALELNKTLTVEPSELLVNHTYELIINSDQRYRCFIVEHNSVMRRVEQFDSLDEIFDCLISGQPLVNHPNASLRESILNNDHDLLIEQEAGSLGSQSAPSALSYFRMFQAMHEYEKRIQLSKSDVMIEQYGFVIPGCLIEMKNRIETELDREMNVFNWYMAQEFNRLIKLAKCKAKAPSLEKRLSSLSLRDLDKAKDIGSHKYRKLIKKKSDYVTI
ncbi:hypothetical protein GCM10009112_23780 [Marinomonas arenicola]|uniref:hypothetical protein n=1 Tax=Marinomonas TaxID=28253 RepID=UPI0010560432|nr:hypothetical protein [Marinomonas sp. KMM3893]